MPHDNCYDESWIYEMSLRSIRYDNPKYYAERMKELNDERRAEMGINAFEKYTQLITYNPDLDYSKLSAEDIAEIESEMDSYFKFVFFGIDKYRNVSATDEATLFEYVLDYFEDLDPGLYVAIVYYCYTESSRNELVKCAWPQLVRLGNLNKVNKVLKNLKKHKIDEVKEGDTDALISLM